MGGSRRPAESLKTIEQPTEKKKGLADWMNLIKPPNEEKDHWVTFDTNYFPFPPYFLPIPHPTPFFFSEVNGPKVLAENSFLDYFYSRMYYSHLLVFGCDGWGSM